MNTQLLETFAIYVGAKVCPSGTKADGDYKKVYEFADAQLARFASKVSDECASLLEQYIKEEEYHCGECKDVALADLADSIRSKFKV